MASVVFFHAHPDDESLSTAGVIVQACARGHRVVLVCATDGALGEAPEAAVPAGSTLAEVRAAELAEAAETLGVHRLEFLGYGDSGMENEPSNDDPDCFWQADIDAAASRLAAILTDEEAALLTVYDSHGNYGHPDHVQVHRVGIRAAEMAATPRVFEATMNRDHMRALADLVASDDPDALAELEERREEMRETDLGSPAEQITHAVDVSDAVETKRRALAAHRSQVGDDSFFMTMPEEAFRIAFGTEWFIQRGARRAGEPYENDILAGLADN